MAQITLTFNLPDAAQKQLVIDALSDGYVEDGATNAEKAAAAKKRVRGFIKRQVMIYQEGLRGAVAGVDID